MDAALCLGRGHALHTMDAALVLQLAVDAASLNRGDRLFAAAGVALADRQHVEPPSLALRESCVHAEEFCGKQRRFLAAGAGADLEDDVLLVVWILRNQEDLDLLEQRFLPGRERLHLLRGQPAHLGIRSAQKLFGSGDVLFDGLVLAILLNEWLHVGERLRRLSILDWIRLHLAGAEAVHQLVVTRFDR
jgi:hypothetical protein